MVLVSNEGDETLGRFSAASSGPAAPPGDLSRLDVPFLLGCNGDAGRRPRFPDACPGSTSPPGDLLGLEVAFLLPLGRRGFDACPRRWIEDRIVGSLWISFNRGPGGVGRSARGAKELWSFNPMPAPSRRAGPGGGKRRLLPRTTVDQVEARGLHAFTFTSLPAGQVDRGTSSEVSRALRSVCFCSNSEISCSNDARSLFTSVRVVETSRGAHSSNAAAMTHDVVSCP